MKALLALTLTVVVILALSNAAMGSVPQQRNADASHKEGLQISLVAPKRRYKRNEKLKFYVMLTNVSSKNIYVLSALEWGYLATLLFHIRDASGNELEPRAFPDDQTYTDVNDERDFLKLRPRHFVGTEFFADFKLLNITKPGKYSVYVEYWSKVPADKVSVKPFWGSENGTIFSNLVWFEVVK